MTIEEIQTRKESQTFDCKSIQIEPKALAIPIVAMANADGGVLAIGISDKEFGEGMDRIYRELAVNNAIEPRVHLDTFILKITVNKSEVRVIEKVSENADRVSEKVSDVIENDEKLLEKAEKLTEKVPDVIEKRNRVIENVIEKAKNDGFSMTNTHIKLLQLMLVNPYVSQADLAKALNVTSRTIARNIEILRGKYLNRVGPDKGGFWEVIEP